MTCSEQHRRSMIINMEDLQSSECNKVIPGEVTTDNILNIAFAREPSTFSATVVASPWRVCWELVVETRISRQRTYFSNKQFLEEVHLENAKERVGHKHAQSWIAKMRTKRIETWQWKWSWGKGNVKVKQIALPVWFAASHMELVHEESLWDNQVLHTQPATRALPR